MQEHKYELFSMNVSLRYYPLRRQTDNGNVIPLPFTHIRPAVFSRTGYDNV